MSASRSSASAFAASSSRRAASAALATKSFALAEERLFSARQPDGIRFDAGDLPLVHRDGRLSSRPTGFGFASAGLDLSLLGDQPIAARSELTGSGFPGRQRIAVLRAALVARGGRHRRDIMRGDDLAEPRQFGHQAVALGSLPARFADRCLEHSSGGAILFLRGPPHAS